MDGVRWISSVWTKLMMLLAAFLVLGWEDRIPQHWVYILTGLCLTGSIVRDFEIDRPFLAPRFGTLVIGITAAVVGLGLVPYLLFDSIQWLDPESIARPTIFLSTCFGLYCWAVDGLVWGILRWIMEKADGL